MSEKTETIYDRIRREARERQEAERERTDPNKLTERLQKEYDNNELIKRLVR
jgi:hypothetical protein